MAKLRIIRRAGTAAGWAGTLTIRRHHNGDGDAGKGTAGRKGRTPRRPQQHTVGLRAAAAALWG